MGVMVESTSGAPDYLSACEARRFGPGPRSRWSTMFSTRRRWHRQSPGDRRQLARPSVLRLKSLVRLRRDDQCDSVVAVHHAGTSELPNPAEYNEDVLPPDQAAQNRVATLDDSNHARW